MMMLKILRAKWEASKWIRQLNPYSIMSPPRSRLPSWLNLSSWKISVKFIMHLSISNATHSLWNCDIPTQPTESSQSTTTKPRARRVRATHTYIVVTAGFMSIWLGKYVKSSPPKKPLLTTRTIISLLITTAYVWIWIHNQPHHHHHSAQVNPPPSQIAPLPSDQTTPPDKERRWRRTKWHVGTKASSPIQQRSQ